MSRSDVLDILGICLLALFAYAIWPAASLLVLGVAAIVMAWVNP